MVLVERCQNGPPIVDSSVVQCCICELDCWLSKYSGNETMAVARFFGDDRIVCRDCYNRIITEME